MKTSPRKISCEMCGAPMLKHSAYNYCVACANKLGKCTSCKGKDQDRPGYKTCTRCWQFQKARHEKLLARTGSRGVRPEWQIREIEQSKALSAKLLAECLAAKGQ